MKGLIFDIRRFSVHDGPGIRTTVFFKGCPLRCSWCHNPEGMTRDIFTIHKSISLDGKAFEKIEKTGKEYEINEVMSLILKDRIFYETSGGGVTFSGGEPMMQDAFLETLLIKCGEEKINTAIDTSGFASADVFQRIAPLTSLFLFDIKHHDEEIHTQFTGVSLQHILCNLQLLLNMGKEIHLRIPVIPNFNATENDINKIILLLSKFSNLKNVSLLPFHTTANEKYIRLHQNNPMSDTKSLAQSEMQHFKKLFELNGYAVKIGG